MFKDPRHQVDDRLIKIIDTGPCFCKLDLEFHIQLADLLLRLDAALDLLIDEPERRARLHANRERLTAALREAGFDARDTQSGIVPVFLPDGVAGRFNRRLHERGLFVNVMEYPMVAPGTERLRFSLMSEHTDADIARAVRLMRETAAEFGLLPAETAAACAA